MRPSISLLLLLSLGSLQASDVLPLKWDQLNPRIANRKVAVVLPDGTHVEGKAIAAEPAGLRLKVTKTSDRNVQPKGEHVLPRQALSLLRVTEYGRKGRLIGAFGAPAAAAGIVGAQNIEIWGGPAVVAVPVMIAAGIVGSGVAGYYIGKRADRRITDIRIVPEQ